MPEGPSIKIVAEEIKAFKSRTIVSAHGNAKIDMDRLAHKKIIDIKTWGKHLLLCFSDCTLRIHFLMFGTYLIDNSKKTPLKLGLEFPANQLNFYTCSIKLLEGSADDNYDWSADVMHKSWNPKKAVAKILETPDTQIGDALLDQNIFSGVGNIIRNEVLFRTKVHPESTVGNIPRAKLLAIAKEASTFAFDFLHWRRRDELDKHLELYGEKKDVKGNPVEEKYTGKTKRRSYISDLQKKY